MGKRGPKPTPRAILKLKGSRAADYLPDQAEAELAVPRMPSWLLPLAKTKWKELTKELEALGVIGTIDSTALAMLCQAHARYRECEDYVSEYGLYFTMTDQAGNTIDRLCDMAREMDRIREFLLRAHADFGMTPSARTRISVTGKPKKGELQKFLTG